MILPVLLLTAVLQDPQAAAPAQPASASAQPFLTQGLILYKKRRFRAARDEFQKAVDADPTSAPAHYYLGYTLYKIGEPTRRLTNEKEQSRGLFARAFELDPSFRPSWRP